MSELFSRPKFSAHTNSAILSISYPKHATRAIFSDFFHPSIKIISEFALKKVFIVNNSYTKTGVNDKNLALSATLLSNIPFKIKVYGNFNIWTFP